MVAQIVWETVDLGNYTLTRVMRQLDGACGWLSMDGCPIIREICDSGVWGGGIRELGNSARELHLYEGHEAA